MIVTIDSHIRAFERAHQAVIHYLGGDINIISGQPGDHFWILKTGWWDLHKIRIPGERASWRYLQFQDERAYALWLLRYS